MTLKTKSIRADIESDDGLRICVMRNYNPKKHPDYKPIDEHWIELSPSLKLLKDYQNGLPWEDYISRFRDEVLVPKSEKIKELAKLAIEEKVTILCYEESPKKCHRRLIALACQTYQPNLELILK